MGHRLFAVAIRFRPRPSIASRNSGRRSVRRGPIRFRSSTTDGYQIFLEVYDRATKRGHIGVSRLSRDGVFERPVPVLERPYHLSYPFVFRWRDQWFMMPETSNAARIEVFSAQPVPI